MRAAVARAVARVTAAAEDDDSPRDAARAQPPSGGQGGGRQEGETRSVVSYEGLRLWDAPAKEDPSRA